MRNFVFILSVLCLLWMSSCSKYDDADPQNSPNTTLTAVAVFNAVPGSTRMDVYIDDKKINTTTEVLRYDQSIPHKNVYAGKTNIRIESFNKDGKDTYTGSIDLPSGKIFTLFVNKDRILQVVQVEDNFIKPKPGYIKIRMAHLSPDVPNLDLKDDKSTVLFKDVKYKQVTDFLEVSAPTTWNLLVRPNSSSISYPQLDLLDFVPQSQEIYILMIRGYGKSSEEGTGVGMKLIKYNTR